MISWPLVVALLLPSEFALEPHEKIELILWLIVAAISLVPVVIFYISYNRVRSTKLLITMLAFFLFFIKALILAVRRFMPNYVDHTWWWVAAVLDIMIICLITFSLKKKD
jgi:hypothetical protein